MAASWRAMSCGATRSIWARWTSDSAAANLAFRSASRARSCSLPARSRCSTCCCSLASSERAPASRLLESAIWIRSGLTAAHLRSTAASAPPPRSPTTARVACAGPTIRSADRPDHDWLPAFALPDSAGMPAEAPARRRASISGISARGRRAVRCRPFSRHLDCCKGRASEIRLGLQRLQQHRNA